MLLLPPFSLRSLPAPRSVFGRHVRATSAERVSEQRRKNEEVLRHNAERERERALESQERAELNEYVADINLAHQSILAGNLARATELLAKHRDTGSQRFEWRYLWHAAQGDDHRLFAQEASSIPSLANSPEWLVVGLQDSVRIYDAKTGSLVKDPGQVGFFSCAVNRRFAGDGKQRAQFASGELLIGLRSIPSRSTRLL